MDINRAMALAAAGDEPELRRAYGAAVSHGAKNTGCTAEVERAYGTLRLLTLALVRLPDLAVCAHFLDMVGEPEEGIWSPGRRATLPRGRCGWPTGRSRSMGAMSDIRPARGSTWRCCGRRGARLQGSADEDEPVALDEARSATWR